MSELLNNNINNINQYPIPYNNTNGSILIASFPINENLDNLFFQDLADSSSEDLEARINRNYELLMIERNQGLSHLNDSINNNIYNKIFNEIRNKLLIISDENEESISVSDSFRKKFLEDNYLSNTLEVINHLKKKVVNIHNKKIELDIIFNESTLKFKKFSDLIIEVITNFNGSNELSDSNDSKLSDLLMEKINKYYSFLDLENLKNQTDSINKEYLTIKHLFYELSGLIPASTCQICLENQINYFIDPCGHTICTTCKEKRPGLQKCHFCRTNVSTFKRLYL